MKNEYAQWRKLDNAALAFPAVTGKNDTRVFRFYCELKEEIKEENLQEALERTLEKYPLFRAVLRKGLFWFYLERRDIPRCFCSEHLRKAWFPGSSQQHRATSGYHPGGHSRNTGRSCSILPGYPGCCTGRQLCNTRAVGYAGI